MRTCQQCSNPDHTGEGLCMECYDEKYLRVCSDCKDTFIDKYGAGICPGCDHVYGEMIAEQSDQAAEMEHD